MPDVSVIIVAYNPDMTIFERVLHAVTRLRQDDLEAEVLLIDNNSRPALMENEIVRQFLQTCRQARLVVEPRQGSGYARLRGFYESASPLLVTFDDDNEPSEDYLLEAKAFFDKHPDLGAGGPGIIRVEYTEGAPAYFEKFRYVFQESKMDRVVLTDARRPNEYYPYGTGMIIRRELALDYAKQVEEGNYRSIGRIGKVLTSCEDLQLVWHGLRNMNMQVGRTPACQLNHLINRRKANYKYWKKLSYGGGYSWLPARFEVFPEEITTVKNTRREVGKSILRLSKVFVYNFYRPRFFMISVASQLGILDSIYHINQKRPPFYLNWLRSLMGLG